MPVLMNKGADPRRAAWLFYTPRSVLEAFWHAAEEGRFESGVLEFDEADLEAAKKPGSEVTVYLAVETVVPDDVDLEAARGEVVAKAQAAAEAVAREEGDDEAEGDQGDRADDDGPAADVSYEPLPATDGVRVAIGTTTRLAAENYLHAQRLDDQDWRPELPGLQMLAQLIELMAKSQAGIPACMVWHVDEGGIMRMAPAKQVKPMAGNTLKVKL